ncbi:probable disease resistance protein At4g27220 [Neltuma alba]|uniref:probable disease resistance protein At4g27220 n=1 Tax=Neltuma alba TaxID=207710 RepID=UPI0010A54825|nr:probable disease resistance protein At4g27220 [Prosopis alba]
MASDSKKFKILLTSRHKEVLSSEMEVKDSIFKVNVMEEEESEMLFNKVAGITDEDSELKSISTKIVLKCANLPLAIEAAGKALKNNKNKVAWENALQQLEKQEMIEVLEPVEFSTMLSYDRLQSEELKSIFLLCARLGKDPSIMYLVKYCIGLRIFQEVNTMKEVRGRTNESIKKLKDSSLLLDTNSPDCVAMHDMIRDAALSIAYKHNGVFTRRYAELDEWPDRETFEKYTVISLHYCDIIDGIPEGINCPQLKVFHLDSKDPFMKIPDKLFEGMKELRVLILIGIDLSGFPSSIKCLIKLRMLCLEKCVLGDNISIIGELKKLRILSLLGSKFELLPSELRQLGMLQLLDISSCTKLKVIPSNVMSKLNRLEELYMGKTLIPWGVERKTNHNEIASLAELESLQQLRNLDIHIEDITTLPSSLDFDKLDSYKIVIGDSKMLLLEDFQMPYQYKASRVLALHLKKDIDIHSQR